jgi:hypothetical protein
LPAKIKAKIKLLCLTWEIETWLIADPRAIITYLSTNERRARFKCSKPLSKNDAKAFLDREFKKNGKSLGYMDFHEAIKIAQLFPDTHRIQRIPSFTRFANLICGNPNANFKLCGKVCNDLAHKARQLGHR